MIKRFRFGAAIASPNFASLFYYGDQLNIVQASPNDAFLRAADGDARMADKFLDAATSILQLMGCIVC